jgi:hypothetical protein
MLAKAGKERTKAGRRMWARAFLKTTQLPVIKLSMRKKRVMEAGGLTIVSSLPPIGRR